MTYELQPQRRLQRILGWSALFLLPALAFAWVAVPVFKIMPFSPQTVSDLKTSYVLRSWSTVFVMAALPAAVGLTIALWSGANRWWRRALLILPLIPLLFLTWFTRQNHFEWMFSPLRNREFVSSDKADFVAGDEMVMAVKIGNDAVAFPIRQIAYHHVVQETIGGVPIVATY